MGKYKGREDGGGGNYCQVWREGIKQLNQHNKKIPYSVRWLYIQLHELEHRFCGTKNVDWFFRSIKGLQEDTKMGRNQVIKGIKMLKDLNLIETWQMHWWLDDDHTKKSPKHVTAFRILEPSLINHLSINDE